MRGLRTDQEVEQGHRSASWERILMWLIIGVVAGLCARACDRPVQADGGQNVRKALRLIERGVRAQERIAVALERSCDGK